MTPMSIVTDVLLLFFFLRDFIFKIIFLLFFLYFILLFISINNFSSSETDGETDNSINTPKVLQNGTSSHSPPTKNISPAKDCSNSPPKPLCAFGNNMQVAGILPGMGHYSDSSDSSNDSNSESEVNDSDSEPCDIFGRVPQTHCDDGCHWILLCFMNLMCRLVFSLQTIYIFAVIWTGALIFL